MRHSRTFIVILALIVAACGRTGGQGRRTGLPASTGFYDQETGVDYVSQDPRVEKALAEDDPAAQPPAAGGHTVNPPSTAALTPADLPLREMLKEFEISRFDEGAATPSRFGSKKFRVKFFMKKGTGRSVEFTGEFGGSKPNLTVAAEADGYQLTGFINDLPQQSKGEFRLTKGNDSARVFYWAYRANLRVREDRTQTVVAGSSLDQQLRSLRENTFGWVHNWTVVRGRAFYMVDIVRVHSAGQAGGGFPDGTFFSFKGESGRTGDQVHNADILGGGAQSVQLVGNSEQGAERSFAVTLSDSSSKELNEVMIDIDLDEGSSPGITPDDPPPVVHGPPPSTDGGTTPPTDGGGFVGPGPADGGGSQGGGQEQPPIIAGDAYLQIDMTKTRTAKIINDFNRNRNLEGVKAKIREYQGGGRGGLTKFFKYANPFRRIMEIVGATFDVSPAFAYLTVVESAYFTGGNYVIERPKRRDGSLISSALGPFQILEGTAKGNIMGMHVTHLWKNDPNSGDNSQDERKYFVPSACGAARYMKYLVGLFDDSDTTLSILGYFQGEGGAAAAIFCAFDSSVTDRNACVRRINNGYSGADYGRFMRLAKNYNYTYAEMERRSAGLTQAMKNYVNGKLAVYFIANDMKSFAFSIPADAPRTFNEKARPTVMPARALNDETCSGAVRAVL